MTLTPLHPLGSTMKWVVLFPSLQLQSTCMVLSLVSTTRPESRGDAVLLITSLVLVSHSLVWGYWVHARPRLATTLLPQLKQFTLLPSI